MISNLGFFTQYKPASAIISDVLYYKNEAGIDFYELTNDAEALQGFKQFYAIDPLTNLVTCFFDTLDGVIPEDRTILASTTRKTLYLNQLSYYDADANEIRRGSDKEDEFETMLNGLPVAAPTSVQEILAIQFRNLSTDVVIRRSDQAVVGVQIINIQANSSNLASLLELNTFNDACIKRGVPSIQTFVGSEELDKDTLTKHVVKRFSFKSIIGTTKNYAWLPMTVVMWANRQWTLIKELREVAATADVAFKDTTFQADDRSRQNLLETITAIEGGGQRPPVYTWRDADNIDRPVNVAELRQLAGLMTDQKNTTYRVSWQRKAEIDAIVNNDGTDAEKIAAIQAVQ